VITARATRLVRVGDLQAFRGAIVALACDRDPVAARDRLVIVPTRAAGLHLLRSIEDLRVADCGVAVLPDFVTVHELIDRLASRLRPDRPRLTDAEREVILAVSCRSVAEAGTEPPFRLRPGLIAEMLRFYDSLRRRQRDVAAFERLALGMLEPGASYDRGAERLVRQTRFLAAAFREFERRVKEAGADEHELRGRLVAERAVRPLRHVIVAVGDRSFDPHGLETADWDVLARIPGLDRLDLVITDRRLAGAQHERIHQLLPGMEEVRLDAGDTRGAPVLAVPPGDAIVHTSRDREEEVAGFARRVKRALRRGELAALDRAALVVHQPLPYLYVARDVLRAAGIPCQLFDALPLAGEPYAAALDLVFSFVSGNFARVPSISLLRSPHFHVTGSDESSWRADVAALDRALSEAGYLGDAESLERLVAAWSADTSSDRRTAIVRSAEALSALVRELAPLRTPAPVALHLDRLTAFLLTHESTAAPADPLTARHLRARAAVLSILGRLRAAYMRFDDTPVEFDDVAALVRRWIEGHTFAPRSGDGVHVVDDRSAAFGDFDHVQLAGLVEGEWPDRPRRDIFYSTGILRELGWPADGERLDAARASFVELLRLPSSRLVASNFQLEGDSLVSPSPLLDELDRNGLDAIEEPDDAVRIFAYEALGEEPVDASVLCEAALVWAAIRREAPLTDDPRLRGRTRPHAPRAYSLSALERYQDCPFKFFASDVLGLQEAPEDEHVLSPRARGRFLHEVFQRFFEAWDQSGNGPITPDTLDAARRLFAEVAEPLLARLPDSDAALERARLFGSAISVGIVDTVLTLEATRPADVRERWLEFRLEGDFSLGTDARRVALRGVADRIDLLAGRRLRVVDYKTGSAPNPRRALQVPIYALCAQERLSQRDGVPWTVEDGSYVAFTGKRSVVPVVRAGSSDAGEVLDAARLRLFEVVDGVQGGQFPPRPHDPMICRYCAFASVCRKDYVGDD
jgi:RecB family exonuclease